MQSEQTKGLCYQSEVVEDDKIKHSDKTQGSYTASVRSLPDRDFKAGCGFKVCKLF